MILSMATDHHKVHLAISKQKLLFFQNWGNGRSTNETMSQQGAFVHVPSQNGQQQYTYTDKPSHMMQSSVEEGDRLIQQL